MKHGCKYGENETCPVVTKAVTQTYLCMDCSDEGFTSVDQVIQDAKAKGSESNRIIVVHTEPDAEMAAHGTPFFWAIHKWSGQVWFNEACGWGKTRLGAFRDAEWKYELLIEKDENRNSHIK